MGSKKLICPYWITCKFYAGDLTANVRKWFSARGREDRIEQKELVSEISSMCSGCHYMSFYLFALLLHFCRFCFQLWNPHLLVKKILLAIGLLSLLI